MNEFIQANGDLITAFFIGYFIHMLLAWLQSRQTK